MLKFVTVPCRLRGRCCRSGISLPAVKCHATLHCIPNLRYRVPEPRHAFIALLPVVIGPTLLDFVILWYIWHYYVRCQAYGVGKSFGSGPACTLSLPWSSRISTFFLMCGAPWRASSDKLFFETRSWLSTGRRPKPPFLPLNSSTSAEVFAELRLTSILLNGKLFPCTCAFGNSYFTIESLLGIFW